MVKINTEVFSLSLKSPLKIVKAIYSYLNKGVLSQQEFYKI